MLELTTVGEVQVGDMIMPEEYDEQVGLDGYDECSVEEVVSLEWVDAYQVRITTTHESIVQDRDEIVMRLKRDGSWIRDGRDVSDLVR